METLINKLNDWTDLDIAAYELSIQLGMVDEKNNQEVKWVFWSNNVYGNLLYEMLMKLVEVGLLEYDDEEQRVRRNAGFTLN